MDLRIAQLAPPFESIPPSGYGGTERVVHTLTEELVRRGHHVTLFASADSHTSANLVPIVDEALWHRTPPCNEFNAHREAIFETIAAALDDFDVVHSHLDWMGFALANACNNAPFVSTLHSRLDAPGLWSTYRAFSGLPLVSISNAQRRPLVNANWLGTVHHGIDLDAFEFRPRIGTYLAFLGRVSPDKGLDVAIRVARRAGIRLLIAARPPLPFHHPEFERDRCYFDEVIRPLLRAPGVEMVGEVGGAEKARFLGEAAALIFPIQWPEPFGLVMPESLACGTPVLALREGSVPEVLRHGVTGFVCSLEEELVRAVSQLGDLDRAACRREAERRFSPEAMADGYEEVFARALAATDTRELAALA